MFTGLIEDIGKLNNRESRAGAGKLTVETGLPLKDIAIGDSIAVNGTCLTVEKINPGSNCIMFHTLAETLERTNLGTVPLGGQLNLERALQLNDRLGGHLVSGHVDAVAEVLDITRNKTGDYIVTIDLPDDLAPLVIPKGSIALNGISLTIAALDDRSFAVHMIPHTWNHTNSAALKKNTRVNLEADMIGKFILRQQQIGKAPESRVTMNDLSAAGFTA
ncbi:MAG: riboflavin synthase [Lentisphaeria bacterium]